MFLKGFLRIDCGRDLYCRGMNNLCIFRTFKACLLSEPILSLDIVTGINRETFTVSHLISCGPQVADRFQDPFQASHSGYKIFEVYYSDSKTLSFSLTGSRNL